MTNGVIVLIKVDSIIPIYQPKMKLSELGIKTIYEISGKYDIAVIIDVPNIENINEYIDSIRKIHGVTGTTSMIILK